MAEVDPGDVLRVAAVLEFKGAEDIVNVFHLKHTGAGSFTFAEILTPLADYFDDLYAEITSVLSDEILPNYLSLANITQSTVLGAFAWGSFAGGTDTGDPTASQLCCLAYARTVLSRVQIRKYLGVFTESQMTNGLWLTGVSSACNDFMAYHITAQQPTTGLTLKGCAYNAGLARATFGISPHASTAPVVQRRRREGRGS